jgi:hypothetical protein
MARRSSRSWPRRPVIVRSNVNSTTYLQAAPVMPVTLTRLVRAISIRYTQEAAAGLPGFARPTLLAWSRQNFFPWNTPAGSPDYCPTPSSRSSTTPDRSSQKISPQFLTRLIDNFLATSASTR